MTALLDLAAKELLSRFAGQEPTPGGGSAAALAGALGASLVEMVCGMSKTKSGAPEERRRLEAVLAEVRKAGARLRSLVDEDTAAYDAVVLAYRLPKGTDEEKSVRTSAVSRAMHKATDIPLATAAASVAVLRAAKEALRDGNPNAASDAKTAAALAWAGMKGAAFNVRINAPSLGPAGKRYAEELEALEKDASELAAAIGL